MATRILAARGLGSAVATGLGLLRGPFVRGGRRRRQEELLLELLRQLAMMTEEIHRANLIQEHRITMDLMDRTIDDPSLADARSTLVGVSEAKRRQMLFANGQYGSLLLAYRVGTFGWAELLGHVRVLCRNELFAEYWDRTTEHRRSLPVDSLEWKVGQVVNAILEELAEDPDEWWVVGPTDEGPLG
ncbi:DUF6082 family protein [Streptomyces sp. NPDC003832]